MSVTQLPLNLPHRVALGRDDFLIGPANKVAVALVDNWPDWPAHVAMLVGPEGSGKTHLAEVWRTMSNARRLEACHLADADLPALAACKEVLLEDVDRMPSAAETSLFHLINLIREERGHLLLTTKLGPAQLPIKLPDLASRLRAALTAELGAPDDKLLRAVLEKLFQDRQLLVSESVIHYLLVHMDRSIAVARTLVGEIDRVALARKRRITQPLVAGVLRELSTSS